MKKDMKTLRNEAEALLAGKIDTKAKLCAALPTLVELQRVLELSCKTQKATGVVAKRLAEACTAYAVDHQSVFEKGRLIANQNGVETGDIEIHGSMYHLACGYDGYVRADGEKLTQEFLMGLPEGWRKERFELDKSGVNEAEPSEGELLANGLVEKPKNTWSLAG